MTPKINRKGTLSFRMPAEVKDDVQDMLAARTELATTPSRKTVEHPRRAMLETVLE